MPARSLLVRTEGAYKFRVHIGGVTPTGIRTDRQSPFNGCRLSELVETLAHYDGCVSFQRSCSARPPVSRRITLRHVIKAQGFQVSQSEVASHTGLTRETIVRFERGQLTEFGSRKLLAVLAVLDREMTFNEVGVSGTLDELRRERSGT